jgi:uncharacterized damage-inducible protein DinB
VIRELIGINISLLSQVRTLVNQLDDATFATNPKDFGPHRVGSHLRHVLEFYECFLNGLPSGRIDYDARQRDITIEKSRRAAIARIGGIIRHLEGEALSEGATLSVRMENAEADAFLNSSVGRELQALSSHTIHHFALIAVTLRLHGRHVDPDFGMSPSTLRYQAAQSMEAA